MKNEQTEEREMSDLKGLVRNGMLAQGRNEIQKYLDGKRLTQKQAIKSKCYDCMGGYADGKVDCKIKDCTLYPFMPYNPNKQKSVLDKVAR